MKRHIVTALLGLGLSVLPLGMATAQQQRAGDTQQTERPADRDRNWGWVGLLGLAGLAGLLRRPREESSQRTTGYRTAEPARP
jgi:hypothetical protein